MKGDWAIAFNSYLRPDDIFSNDIDEDLKGPDDMQKLGFLIAQRRLSSGYIGEYYCLSSKRSQFHYVALSTVEAFALTKDFLLKNIFAKFPGLM